ncbi:WhiB family transcriptional regulator [Nocardiopsis sp. NPDC049922]|uniref:WhiB family transcriptional regulator n=1 Tax=Nocardiopsis sp. NPDC049922 TaxID=3155157 RepID=UPI0034039FD2
MPSTTTTAVPTRSTATPALTDPRAHCRHHSPDALFVTGKAQNDAKRICSGCPIRMPCLLEALNDRVEFGVWGGMTERERRALLRARPTVTDWGAAVRGAGLALVETVA